MSQVDDWLHSKVCEEFLKGYRLPPGDPPTFAGCQGDVILPVMTIKIRKEHHTCQYLGQSEVNVYDLVYMFKTTLPER